MMACEHRKSWTFAEDLLAAAGVDTAFADLYLQRARELLSIELTEAQYAAFGSIEDELADVTTSIGTALHERDWLLVRKLTIRAAELRRVLSDAAPIRAVAARIYGFDEVLVDPFSLGTSELAGVAQRVLPALRDAAVKRLERLRVADPAWSDLYEARRRALDELRFTAVDAGAAEGPESRVTTLEARAQTAFVRGNLSQLYEISTQLLDARQLVTAPSGATGTAELTAPVLASPFQREVCDRAARLALAPHRVESLAEEIRTRLRPSLRPSVGDPSGNIVRFSMTIPGDTGEALREALALFMNRAFLTSAGTRYIPWCVAEDVLVEEFDERSRGAATATSPLLAALGLRRRSALPRSEIEKALRERGGAVVKDLGLDARKYRIACIPADVYTRLASRLGWGRQEIWTHFDGYMASETRKLMPLAGGDVRFGGRHDLVAVSADYAPDRLLARFAVVQRRRFATW